MDRTSCLLSLIFFLVSQVNVESIPVADTLNHGFKHVEGLYKDLEVAVEDSVARLQNKAAGVVMGAVEYVDSAISRALVKVQGLREDCRIPAELSLAHLKDKIAMDIGRCADGVVRHRLEMLRSESRDVVQQIRESSAQSTDALEVCLRSQTAALERLRFDKVGSCEIQTGLSLFYSFVDDAAAVQKFIVSTFGGAVDTTGNTVDCFKQDSVDSLINSIYLTAEKCEKRFKAPI